MANEKTPVVWDDATKKHRPLGTGEKMGGLDASSLLSSDSGNLLEAGSDGLAYLSGSGVVDPRADNLLEESDRGKLQVTVDRIAEWLDGHPQDAAVLAEAINVVSGDSGNVIVEGTDKGAFLSKGAISAAVAGMTDAQKAQLADAIAARIASDIADGKTIVASGGKLTADPTNATAAQKKAINQALADASSGLVVDNSTGKLKVDFSQMPTDKFEDLLKGLKMQIPLSGNLDLYVDGASDGDSLVDGRGTQAKPFKTIRACVNYATQTYAVGAYTVTIHVAAGAYSTSQISLPTFTRTGGGIRIQGEGQVTIINASPYMNIFYATGGYWVLHNLTVKNTVDTPTDGFPHYPTALTVSGATVVLQSVELEISYIGTEYSSGVGIRTVVINNYGELRISPNAAGPSSFRAVKGDANSSNIFYIDTNSMVSLYNSNTVAVGDMYNVYVSGTVSNVVYVTSNSCLKYFGGGLYNTVFAVPSGKTVSGRSYELHNSSYILLGGRTTIPGTEGSVDDNTFCYYN